MKKWLVIGALALIAILVVMWREATSSEATAASTVEPTKVAPAPTPYIAAVPLPEEKKPEAPAEPGKVVKYEYDSDEFFHKHDEIVVPQVMRSVVKCWENLDPKKRATFHRNQNIVFKFKQTIKDGKVTMSDPIVERSTWNDPAIESCFKTQLLATTWSDEKLPDWEQEDVIKISPRVLKKYTRENIEYVGPEEPKVPRMITGKELEKDFDPNYKE